MAEAEGAQGDLLNNDAGKGADAGAADAGKADAGKVDAGAADAAKVDAAKVDAAKVDDKGKVADADKAKADTAKAEPVDYAKTIAEVQMPEGVVLDEARVKEGGAVFAKHNLSAEAVKDLVTLYAQQQKAGADGNAKAFGDAVAGWKTDAEKNTSAAERADGKAVALAVFGKDEVALLEHFGVTNRAGFIKALSRLAPAIKDDKLVLGNAVVTSGSDARKQFPNSNMNP